MYLICVCALATRCAGENRCSAVGQFALQIADRAEVGEVDDVRFARHSYHSSEYYTDE